MSDTAATEPTGSHQAAVVAALRNLLDRRVPFLEGVRAVVGLGYEPNGYDYAHGFGFFHWLNGITAHIPGSTVRELCTDAHAAQAEVEEREVEASYGSRVDTECRRLLAGYEP